MDNDETQQNDAADATPQVDAAASESQSTTSSEEGTLAGAEPTSTRGEEAVRSEPEPSAANSESKPKRKRSAKKKTSARRKSSRRKPTVEAVEAAEPANAAINEVALTIERLEGVPSASDEAAAAEESNPLADLIGQASEATIPEAILDPPSEITVADHATTDPEAFPFLEGGADGAEGGDEIVAQAVREALENGSESSEMDPAAAEIDSMPSDTPTEAPSSSEPAEVDAQHPAQSTTGMAPRRARLIAAIKRRLPQSFQRTAVRSLAACVLAIAAGFGYGAAVRTFFGDHDGDLSPENQNSAETSRGEEHAVEQTAPHGVADPAAHTESHDATEAAQSAAHTEGHATAEAGNAHDHASAAENAPRSNRSEVKFEMPALDSSLPSQEHPLAIGRQRLSEGDLQAARRIATSFLLREDSLSADDRLLVSQAYALLADALSVEWNRKHPRSKDSAEVQGLPKKAPTRPDATGDSTTGGTEDPPIPVPFDDGEPSPAEDHEGAGR